MEQSANESCANVCEGDTRFPFGARRKMSFVKAASIDTMTNREETKLTPEMALKKERTPAIETDTHLMGKRFWEYKVKNLC